MSIMTTPVTVSPLPSRVTAPCRSQGGHPGAAYGGIYIAASLVWLWLVEGQRPTTTDLLGAGVAVAGAIVIIAFGAGHR